MSTTLAPPRSAGGTDLPPLDDGERGGGWGWVTLIRATNDIEAHLLAGRLQEAGIEVSLCKDRSRPVWLYGGSNPWDPVIVLVRRIQAEDARIVLAEIALDAPAALPVDDARLQGWRAPVIWWAAALGLGALMTVIGLARTASSMDGCRIPVICSDSNGQR